MARIYDFMTTLFDVNALSFRRSETNSIPDMCQALLSSQGEVSGLTLAADILDQYETANTEGKLAFFKYLNTFLDVSPERISTALSAYRETPDHATYKAFLAAAEAPRQEFIRRLNQVPGATQRLVEMRRELLVFAKSDPALSKLDLDFRHLFLSWFNRGFLVLRPISWTTGADILEKIISYEAVHAIDSWDDLRRRLLPQDRRCFAYFHPAIPDEPLIFVEVALTEDIPQSIQNLLADNRPTLAASKAKTAVFYSISNCQAGLAGISFGNFLIKHVVRELSRELSGLETFVTLSPIPGFAGWARTQNIPIATDNADALRGQVADYLVNAKRKNEQVQDPVARFHLNNGALIHAVHANADISDKGMAQSAGVMVNYLYDKKLITQNHEDFANHGKIAASKEISALLRSYAKTLPAKKA